jgi:hypothetical protein
MAAMNPASLLLSPEMGTVAKLREMIGSGPPSNRDKEDTSQRVPRGTNSVSLASPSAETRSTTLPSSRVSRAAPAGHGLKRRARPSYGTLGKKKEEVPSQTMAGMDVVIEKQREMSNEAFVEEARLRKLETEQPLGITAACPCGAHLVPHALSLLRPTRACSSTARASE